MTDDRGIAQVIADKECWWTISGSALVDLLRRAHAGEDPDALYAREYLSAETEYLGE